MSNQVGSVTEARVLYELQRDGYTTLTHFGDHNAYDIGIDMSGVLIRVQVKTARTHADGGSVMIDTIHGSTRGGRGRINYADSIDLYAAYYPPDDVIYWVPTSVATRTSFSIRRFGVRACRNSHQADQYDKRHLPDMIAGVIHRRLYGPDA